MKTKIWKSETGKQYTSHLMTICILNAKWKQEHDIAKDHDPMMFYGGAYGRVSRQFAADILRQFRKDRKLIGGVK